MGSRFRGNDKVGCAGTGCVRDPFIGIGNAHSGARFRMDDERIRENPDESRQATKTPKEMTLVLGLGIAGVVIAFAIAYFAILG
jgi:hypothetical protein